MKLRFVTKSKNQKFKKKYSLEEQMPKFSILSLSIILCAWQLSAGVKKAVALGQLQWEASLSGSGYHYTKVETQNMLKSLQTMVTTSLSQSRKFEVVERAQIAQAISELGLIHDSGLVDPNAIQDIPEWGQFKGVHYLILGAITQFSIDTSGASVANFGNYQKETMMLEADLRIVDVESGELIDAVPIRTKVNLSAGLNTKETGKLGSKSSAGQKMSTLLRSCAKLIVHRLVSHTLPIRILQVNKDEVVLNYGDGLLDLGDQLVVYQPGQTYVDPDTGESEKELIEVGLLEVFQTQGIISKARRVGKGSRKYNQDDICKLSEEIEAKSGKKGKLSKLKSLFGKIK
jgi:curli biogenesis system outer membrane secretion channel CsgG